MPRKGEKLWPSVAEGWVAEHNPKDSAPSWRELGAGSYETICVQLVCGYSMTGSTLIIAFVAVSLLVERVSDFHKSGHSVLSTRPMLPQIARSSRMAQLS